MYYTIYKTTNKVNGKIYIGAHKTKNLDDGYMGSGLLLGRAIEKYGIENFEKEILGVFDKASDMFEMESELVNEDFISSNDTYNLKIGGNGGWDYINKNGLSNLDIDIKQKSEAGKLGGAILKNKLIDEIYWNEFSIRVKNGIRMYYVNGGTNGWKGKNHTEETKKKIGKANSIHQRGPGNSQYGKMWITNDTESKTIKKDHPIPEGWRKGRKLKKQ